MSYAQLTLANLQTLLTERFDGAQFWTAEQSRLALNEGIRVYNMLTGVFRAAPTPLTLIPNDEFLSLPGTLTYRTRLSVAGVALEPCSLSEMDNAHPNWRGQATNSGGTVPTSVKIWIPAGITLVFVWPRVIVNTTVTVDGIATAPVLVNPTDTIDIGQEDVGPLLGYALHVLAFNEGGERFKDTMSYYKDFISACAQKNSRIRLSNLWRYAQGLDLTRGTTALQQRPVALPGAPTV